MIVNEASLECEVAALRAQVAFLNKLPQGVRELGYFVGTADEVEARRYRDSRNKRKDFKRGIGVGMSHIRLEGRLEKEEEIREEVLKKKQKTKDNRKAIKTQSGLDTTAKNISGEKKKEEKEERDRIKYRTDAQKINKGR